MYSVSGGTLRAPQGSGHHRPPPAQPHGCAGPARTGVLCHGRREAHPHRYPLPSPRRPASFACAAADTQCGLRPAPLARQIPKPTTHVQTLQRNLLLGRCYAHAIAAIDCRLVLGCDCSSQLHTRTGMWRFTCQPEASAAKYFYRQQRNSVAGSGNSCERRGLQRQLTAYGTKPTDAVAGDAAAALVPRSGNLGVNGNSASGRPAPDRGRLSNFGGRPRRPATKCTFRDDTQTAQILRRKDCSAQRYCPATKSAGAHGSCCGCSAM